MRSVFKLTYPAMLENCPKGVDWVQCWNAFYFMNSIQTLVGAAVDDTCIFIDD